MSRIVICEVCGRDTYPGEDVDGLNWTGLDICEGCDQPSDTCTCEEV